MATSNTTGESLDQDGPAKRPRHSTHVDSTDVVKEERPSGSTSTSPSSSSTSNPPSSATHAAKGEPANADGQTDPNAGWRWTSWGWQREKTSQERNHQKWRKDQMVSCIGGVAQHVTESERRRRKRAACGLSGTWL